jgi:hypothetical protein
VDVDWWSRSCHQPVQPVRHIGQSATARVVDGHPATVVDDVDRQHVDDIDLDGPS